MHLHLHPLPFSSSAPLPTVLGPPNPARRLTRPPVPRSAHRPPICPWPRGANASGTASCPALRQLGHARVRRSGLRASSTRVMPMSAQGLRVDASSNHCFACSSLVVALASLSLPFAPRSQCGRVHPAPPCSQLALQTTHAACRPVVCYPRIPPLSARPFSPSCQSQTPDPFSLFPGPLASIAVLPSPRNTLPQTRCMMLMPWHPLVTIP